ncbi:hypothetical protein GCM10027287_13140 [Bordetella muralis]
MAVTSGSHSIAVNLARLSYERNLGLVDSQDDTGYTPIMHAAKSASDDAHVVGALLNAGASVGLSRALESAAERGHALIAERLIASNVDAPKVLSDLVRPMNGEDGLNGAKLLVRLGVDATKALNHLTQIGRSDEARTLVLLGAKGSEALVSAATHFSILAGNLPLEAQLLNTSAPIPLSNLLDGGADVPKALITIVENSGDATSKRAASFLMTAVNNKNRHSIDASPHSDMIAILRLANNGNFDAMVKLVGLSNCIDDLGPDGMTASGNARAIKKLVDSRVNGYPYDNDYPVRLVMTAATTGNLVATKKLLAAGVLPENVLHSLLSLYRQDNPAGLEAIRLLIVAGVDTHYLPADVMQYIHEIKMDVSRLSSTQRNAALLSAARDENAVDVASLLDTPVDTVGALKTLSQAGELDAIRTLLNAGMDALETLTDRLRAGDMNVARMLIQAKDVSSEALSKLVANGELESARALLSIMNDNGQETLVQAARNGHTEIANALVAFGADGHGALISLLESGHQESAVRLVASGVDIHTTLRHAFIDDKFRAKRDLLTLGAKLSVALLQAIELGDIKTAQKLLEGQHKSVGQEATSTVFHTEALTPGVKAARLTQLFQLGANADTLLEKLIDDGRTADLRWLVALGAPTQDLLVDLGRKNNRIDARKLFLAGADFDASIRKLRTDNEHDAAGTLVLALTGARDLLMPSPGTPNVNRGFQRSK